MSGHFVVVLSYHYNDIMMSTMASQITSLTIVYLSVYSGADQRKHQISASLAFVKGIHRWPGASNAENGSIWWRHHDSWGKSELIPQSLKPSLRHTSLTLSKPSHHQSGPSCIIELKKKSVLWTSQIQQI